jgi:hypothetical protein
VTLTPCSGLSPADWLSSSTLPWDGLVTFGPAGFAAYARLRFIPDPTVAGQAETDADVAEVHPRDEDQLRRLVAALAPHTGTPEEVYVAFWDGWGDEVFPPTVRAEPRLHLPHRAYHLVRGNIVDVTPDGRPTWPGEPALAVPVPAFVWPADRAWCITHDVDPHWAGIGAAAHVIDELVTSPDLDIVAADPGHRQPSYG